MKVLIFDSGIGGLTVLREARVLLPYNQFIYVADDAAFPYGNWDEHQLREHMVALFGKLIAKWDPTIIIIACNTASTVGIEALRDAYPDSTFVGTVPAIKPAAERTQSGLVSVLATPGTVKRQYTFDLIKSYASKCHVNLIGSTRLAGLAEDYMRTGYTDEAAVAEEIMPCFQSEGLRRTDIVVLACTHYPFLVNRMRKMAPWPVDWIDTSEAIARRAMDVLAKEMPDQIPDEPFTGRSYADFTNGSIDTPTQLLLAGFGLRPAE